ncbi:MAG: FAD-binding oxidoreductase [Proteobacteria bacterium]|nr:FAD-binding oxidoreductase [Pseudomonadota bacterium]
MGAIETKDLKEKLDGIVGGPQVLSGEEHTGAFARAGVGSGETPHFIVRPQNTKQVEQLIDLAKQCRLNLVPASSGPPHMKGGTLLDAPGVVVDLSGMNNIVLMDRRNKVALVEPGVTYAALQEEADKHNLKVLMPLLPKAGKSVLASYLENDPILIPKYHWDMSDPLLCTEVIFGNGRFYRTGSAGGPGSIKQKIDANVMFKNPLGPGQTDLMKIVQGSQGTMGIVTWASVKLEVKPSIHRMYFAVDGKLERLVDFSYRVLKPKLADEFFIVNRQAFAAMTGRNPDEAKSDEAYIAAYGVSGYDVCPEERVAYQEEDIAKTAQQTGVAVANTCMGITGSKLSRIVARPSGEPYYKDALKGASATIHFLSTMDKSEGFIKVMSDAVSAHGYPASEIGVYIQPILFGRACHIEFSLYYNPQDDPSAAAMEKMHTSASRALADAGAFYSRPYGCWSDLAYSRCADTVTALKRVKQIFDPDHVLNQGKLVFKEAV